MSVNRVSPPAPSSRAALHALPGVALHDGRDGVDKYNTPRLNKPQLGHEFGNWNAFPMLQSLIELFEANASAVIVMVHCPKWWLQTMSA